LADDDVWFALLTLAVAVLAGGIAAMRSIRIARLIEDTPTSRVRSAAQGYVELAGRALPLPDTQNLAPLTQRPCVWWRYRISRKVEGGGGRNRRQRWRTVASGRSSVPFLLDDGTGTCIVKPDGAEIVTTETTTWYGDSPWPAPGGPGGRDAAAWLMSSGRDYRYVEERIYEHEQVYALGDFRSSASNAEQDLQSEQAALLSEWKQDQTALLGRFDVDGDGRLDMDEWEAAREAARRTVIERQVERPKRETLHALCKPDDRLFLLAALPPGDLVKRYRRRAAWSFAGFLAAVYALGWLIQHSFT
jgi:hypothetical protein